MKNIISFFILVSFASMLSSCEETGIFFPTSSNTDSTGVFQVSINGGVFSTENVSFTSDGVDLLISAIKIETNESFTLKVNDFSTSSFSFEGEIL